MRILTVLTFYDPHWTGLTVYAKAIAEGLAARGHDVTVLTSQHLPELARRERRNGVEVVRLAPVARLSRGVLTPAFPRVARRLIGAHDVVHIHTPLLEAPLVATLARVGGKPLLMTHQGDLVMPPGVVNQIVEKVGTAMLSLGARLATAVSPLNDDYARNSAFLRPFAGKSVTILPPVDLPEPDAAAVAEWRAELGLADRRVIGFAGRFVREKGFDRLFAAVPALLESIPDAQLVYAGDHRLVYEDFYEQSAPLVEAHRERVTFVGLIHDRRRLADFYALCDVLVLPSRTDCFPAVQVEAMLCGTPVVAADIPGARVAVQRTGMGLLVDASDAQALAAALAEVLAHRDRYVRPRDAVRAAFDPDASIDAYERLLADLVAART